MKTSRIALALLALLLAACGADPVAPDPTNLPAAHDDSPYIGGGGG